MPAQQPEILPPDIERPTWSNIPQQPPAPGTPFRHEIPYVPGVTPRPGGRRSQIPEPGQPVNIYPI